MKLTQLQVSEKNRYQNCLTWSNLQIASVVSEHIKRRKDKVQDLKIAIEGNVTPE